MGTNDKELQRAIGAAYFLGSQRERVLAHQRGMKVWLDFRAGVTSIRFAEALKEIRLGESILLGALGLDAIRSQ